MEPKLIPTLENESLLLTPWTNDNSEDYLRIFNNSHLAALCGIIQPSSLSDAKKKIKVFEKSKRMEWSIALKAENHPIIVGTIGISEVISIKESANVKEIGYGLSEDYWGKGIMPNAISVIEQYCFHTLQSEAVIIRFSDENKQSKRVAEKCGYEYSRKIKVGPRYKITYI